MYVYSGNIHVVYQTTFTVHYSTNSHCANSNRAATASPSPSSPSVSSYSSAGPSVTSQISSSARWSTPVSLAPTAGRRQLRPAAVSSPDGR